MQLEVWYFLVTANQYIDYRTLIAPDFIVAAGISNLLKNAIADEEYPTAEHCAVCREIHSDAGDITVVFRVVKATEKDIGKDSDNILKDDAGRPIFLKEGIVLKGSLKERFPQLCIGEKDWEKVHNFIISIYTKFWPIKQSSNVEITVSTKNLIDTSDENILQLKFLNPYDDVKRSVNHAVKQDNIMVDKLEQKSGKLWTIILLVKSLMKPS